MSQEARNFWNEVWCQTSWNKDNPPALNERAASWCERMKDWKLTVGEVERIQLFYSEKTSGRDFALGNLHTWVSKYRSCRPAESPEPDPVDEQEEEEEERMGNSYTPGPRHTVLWISDPSASEALQKLLSMPRQTVETKRAWIEFATPLPWEWMRMAEAEQCPVPFVFGEGLNNQDAQFIFNAHERWLAKQQKKAV